MGSRRTDIDERRDEIEIWLRGGIPQAEVARRLECKIDTLKSRLVEWDLKHLKNVGGKGFKKGIGYKPSSYYFSNEHSIKSHPLKLKLYRDGLKEKKCEGCGILEWQGKEAPLELDHVDGNHWNNAFENLRILCANCHAQTPTFCGKNIRPKLGPPKPEPPKRYKSPDGTKIQYYCRCGAMVTRKGLNCRSCYVTSTEKINWPCVCEIQRMVEESNFRAVGKTLGVSDNAVRKRLKAHGCEC